MGVPGDRMDMVGALGERMEMVGVPGERGRGWGYRVREGDDDGGTG